MYKNDISSVSFHKLTGHTKEINCCAFSKQFFVTCSGDKCVRIYSSSSFKEVSYSPLFAHTYAVTYVAFNNDEKYLATASSDGTSKLWLLNDDSAQVHAIFTHSSSAVVQVCNFSLDSSLLVTGSADGSIAVWDVKASKIKHKIEGHPEGTVAAAAFTPCHEYLVTGSAIGDIRVWALKYSTPQCVMQTQAHDEGEAGSGVNAICFSPTFHDKTDETDDFNNYMMASCGQDYKTKLWIFSRRAITQAKVHCLKAFNELCGHHGVVSSCCFSHDGNRLASSSFDKTVIIWNPLTCEQQIVLRGHTSLVYGVAFSCDDSYLASVSYDKVTIIWKLTLDRVDKPAETNDKAITQTSELNEPLVKLTDAEPPTEVQNNQSNEQMSKEQVLDWLVSTVGLKQYYDVFNDNEIDGDELFALTSETLTNDLQIKPLGHRNKILRGIKELSISGNTKSPYPKAATDVTFKLVESTPTVTNISKSRSAAEETIPKEYVCPISHEIMQNPVIAADGFTYEKSAIESWIQTGSNLSPMTNKQLLSNNLTPNLALKSLVENFLENTPILKY